MPSSCCLKCCRGDNESHLYRFPVDVTRRQLWLNYCNRIRPGFDATLTANHRLCSVRFRPCFCMSLSYSYLARVINIHCSKNALGWIRSHFEITKIQFNIYTSKRRVKRRLMHLSCGTTFHPLSGLSLPPPIISTLLIPPHSLLCQLQPSSLSSNLSSSSNHTRRSCHLIPAVLGVTKQCADRYILGAEALQVQVCSNHPFKRHRNCYGEKGETYQTQFLNAPLTLCSLRSLRSLRSDPGVCIIIIHHRPVAQSSALLPALTLIHY